MKTRKVLLCEFCKRDPLGPRKTCGVCGLRLCNRCYRASATRCKQCRRIAFARQVGSQIINDLPTDIRKRSWDEALEDIYYALRDLLEIQGEILDVKRSIVLEQWDRKRREEFAKSLLDEGKT